MLEPSWDGAQDGKPGFLPPVSVHKPRDKYVEQDGKGRSEGANEEVDLGSGGIAA